MNQSKVRAEEKEKLIFCSKNKTADGEGWAAGKQSLIGGMRKPSIDVK